MSLSIPGHHTYILANDFIQVMPGWPSFNSCRTAVVALLGTTTREPHRMHPSNNDSSSFLTTNGLNFGSHWSGHPLLRYWRTCARSGSRRVYNLICCWVRGDSDRCSMSSTSFGGFSLGWSTVFSGSRLRASALPCSVVLRNFKVYSYPDKNKDHRLIHADAWGEVGLCQVLGGAYDPSLVRSDDQRGKPKDARQSFLLQLGVVPFGLG